MVGSGWSFAFPLLSRTALFSAHWNISIIPARLLAVSYKVIAQVNGIAEPCLPGLPTAVRTSFMNPPPLIAQPERIPSPQGRQVPYFCAGAGSNHRLGRITCPFPQKTYNVS